MNLIAEAIKKGLISFDDEQKFITYIHQKLFLLTLAHLTFLKEFLLFQKKLKATGLLNPFSAPTCTLGGAFFRLYKILYLSKYPQYTILNEYKSRGKFISRIEHEYMSYIEQKLYPNDVFLSALNNPKGQKYFREAIPDGFAPNQKIAYMVCGCYWHLCERCNLVNDLEKCKNASSELLTKFERLIANNPSEIDRVEVIWECDINKMKIQDAAFAMFLDQDYIKRPLKRLIPRDCFKGAYHDTYCLSWSADKFPQEEALFLDINGLYSDVSIKNKFMYGKYLNLIGGTVNDLKIIDGKFYYCSKRVMGSIFLSILAPQNLLYPFLLYKAKNGLIYNTLCTACIEKNEQKVCNHSDNERCLIGCYMLSEIEYALTLGYKILHVFECHVYTEYDYILKDFVQALVYMKTISSNCFENINSMSDKNNYCKILNKKMKLENDLLLSPSVIKPNPAKRHFYKIAQNTFFGKFGQRRDLTKVLYCSTQEEIESFLVENTAELNDAYVINSNLCAVSYKPNSAKLKPSLKTNMYISAQITSFARETIHRAAMLLHDKSIKLLKINCDSLIFALTKDQVCPFEISHAVGDYKHEIHGKILNFFALGCKNYVIIYRDSDFNIRTINKISGLSLKSETIDLESYNLFLQKLKEDIDCILTVNNRKRKINWKNLTFKITTEKFTIGNKFHLRRIIKPNCDLYTVPYGYCAQ